MIQLFNIISLLSAFLSWHCDSFGLHFTIEGASKNFFPLLSYLTINNMDLFDSYFLLNKTTEQQIK